MRCTHERPNLVHMSHHEHRDHQHDHGALHHHAFDTPEMAAFAEMEGELFVGVAQHATSALAALADRQRLDVQRVLDGDLDEFVRDYLNKTAAASAS